MGGRGTCLASETVHGRARGRSVDEGFQARLSRRWAQIGPSPYPGEEEGLGYVRGLLPGRIPHRAVTLFTFTTFSGRVSAEAPIRAPLAVFRDDREGDFAGGQIEVVLVVLDMQMIARVRFVVDEPFDVLGQYV